MSRYNDMSREDRRREDRREYKADVYYDVWRSGKNPDAINLDRVDDNYWNGVSEEDAARQEIQSQRPKEQYHEEEPESEEQTP